LKSEREEVDKKRSEILKLQGEFKEKIRLAEDQLLDAISQNKGEILENDDLIKKLETLKSDAAEMQVKLD
jgi:dynein heavy chain 1